MMKKRHDDGTIDLYEVRPSGKLDFLSNHPTMDEARNERDSYNLPMSQGDTLAFFHDLKHAINNS